MRHPMYAFIANMTAIFAVSLLGFASASVPALSREGAVYLRENAQGVSSGNCLDGWVDASFVEMGCLYFNSTKALSSWDETSSMCQTATPNSTLVEIRTAMQLAFVQMMIGVLADHEGPRYWWTAGTDVGINGKWFWASSLTPVEDYVWPDNYPDSRDTANCMILDFSGMTGAYNSNCDYTNAYPICQLK